MSGYRVIHREVVLGRSVDRTEASSDGNRTCVPVWSIRFSPCRQPTVRPAGRDGTESGSATRRVLAATGEGVVRGYEIVERSTADAATSQDLKAIAKPVSMRLRHVLLGPEGDHKAAPTEATIGYGCLHLIRNYVGDDKDAGDEITAAITLDGKLRLWLRDEQPLRIDRDDQPDEPQLVTAVAELHLPEATGTSLAIRPPPSARAYAATQSNAHRSKQPDAGPEVVLAVGCVDGSIALVRTGLARRLTPNARTTRISLPTKNSDAASDEECFISPSVVDRIAGGSDENSLDATAILSLAWNPTVVARETGYSSVFAAGRRDGSIDVYARHTYDDEDESFYYQGINTPNDANASGKVMVAGRRAVGRYRRIHRLVHHKGPLRGLSYSPDGGLLVSASEEGHVRMFDSYAGAAAAAAAVPAGTGGALADKKATHSNSESKQVSGRYTHVNYLLGAHGGSWVLGLSSTADSRRFVTSGADSSVKVWDISAPRAGPLHTFEANGSSTEEAATMTTGPSPVIGTSMIWDVDTSADGHRIVAASQDGRILLMTSEEVGSRLS